MGEPLKRMVAAMWAELKNQEQESPQGRASDVFATTPTHGEIYGVFDLEKVARAALEAIREPADDLTDVIYSGDISSTPEEAWRLAIGKLVGDSE